MTITENGLSMVINLRISYLVLQTGKWKSISQAETTIKIDLEIDTKQNHYSYKIKTNILNFTLLNRSQMENYMH